MAKKAAESKEFLNPFEAGVNYKMFMDAKGDLSVAEFCKDHLKQDQIEWLENDLKHFTK